MVRPSRCEVAVALHACDAVATITSTVALEGHALGLPVLQVRGSIFDHSMPLASMGLARECSVDGVPRAIEAMFADHSSPAGAQPQQYQSCAADRVAEQVTKLLKPAAN